MILEHKRDFIALACIFRRHPKDVELAFGMRLETGNHFEDRGFPATRRTDKAEKLAFSDIQISYEEMVGEGDSLAYRYTWRARHTGQSPALGIPPTGKEALLQGCIVVHLAGGKIVEEFEYSDYLGFLQQLGVVPPLG